MKGSSIKMLTAINNKHVPTVSCEPNIYKKTFQLSINLKTPKNQTKNVKSCQ